MKKLPPAYRGDEPYVFVCYGHTDTDVVMAEIDWLKHHGVNVWYDEGISPGAEWREELGDAIRNCRLFLFFVSPSSIASPNCRRELNLALDDDRSTLAIHLEETTLSDGLRLSLSDRQAIFRYLETEDGYRDKLAASIDRALAADAGQTGTARHQGSVAAARRQRRIFRRLALAAVMTILLAAAWYAGRRTIPAQPAPRVTAFEIGPVDAFAPFSRALAISADGRRLAYVDSGVTYVRSLDTLDATALGTLGNPFFSPDAAWVVGEVGAGSIARVPRSGGAQSEISSAGGSRFYGGSWGDSGVIVYADTRGLFRIANVDGAAELLAAPDSSAGEVVYGEPQLLPGERALLFTIVLADSSEVAVLDMQTLANRVLLPAAFSAQYVDGGYLVFAQRDGLHAVRFDLHSLSVVGDPISLDMPVALTAGAQYAMSRSGTLAYVPARSEGLGTLPTLSWVDRMGREEPLNAPAAGWVYPRLSPDGRYIVSDVAGASRNIRVWDLKRRNMIPLTDTPTEDMMPLWSSDERVVYFASDRRGTFDVFATPADGSGTARLLYGVDGFEVPQAITRGDARLVINVQGKGFDLHSIDPSHPDVVAPLLVTPYNELNPSLSPDGRWFAYQSDASGKYEIYVRPFEDPRRGRWKVSIDGGTAPLWSPYSDEIFFRNASGDMMAASYVTKPDFDIKNTVALFPGSTYRNTFGGRNYDVSRVDRRFLMLKEGRQPEGPQDSIVVVVNWSEQLKRLLP